MSPFSSKRITVRMRNDARHVVIHDAEIAVPPTAVIEVDGTVIILGHKDRVVVLIVKGQRMGDIDVVFSFEKPYLGIGVPAVIKRIADRERIVRHGISHFRFLLIIPQIRREIKRIGKIYCNFRIFVI